MESTLRSELRASLGPPVRQAGKFKAIWQSEPDARDWPLVTWLTNLFAPYISETIYDGKHQVVLDNAILFDAWVYARDPAYYAKFHGKNVFLVHPFDEFLDLGVDRYVHFRGVFRMIWSSVFNSRHVMVIPLGSYIDKPPAVVIPSSERRYAWSFIGDAGKVSRPDMVRAMSAIEPHICFSDSSIRGMTFFDRNAKGAKRFSKDDFYQIMGQSVFAPAPQGNATLESCRPYDGLEVGCIPIIERRLTLDYYKQFLGDHPLPTVSSWSQAPALVKELLSDPVRLDNLQQTCTQWWRKYKADLIDRIGNFLDERSNTQDEVVPLRSILPRLPLWQYGELLRHHDLPGLGRRLARQARRIVSERKWRVAITKQGDV
jgi:hypothetical protein